MPQRPRLRSKESWPKPDQSAQVQPEVETLEVSDFSALLQREFKPKTDQAKEAVESAVKTLAEQALQYTSLVSNDVVKSIESMVAALDQKITEQLNAILHHPDFQAAGERLARSASPHQ
jgi:type VI secretion system protein ImpC